MKKISFCIIKLMFAVKARSKILLCGATERILDCSLADSFLMSKPLIKIVPEVGFSTPPMRFISVVLPDPFAPVNNVAPVGDIDVLKFLKISLAGLENESCFISIMIHPLRTLEAK